MNGSHSLRRLVWGLLALFLHAASASAQIQVEAYSGAPFGVGRMTVTVPRAVDRELADDGYLLVERDGRALYSVLVDRPVQRILRDLFNGGRPILQRPEQVTVFFLFQGDKPLELNFYTPDLYRAAITPRNEPNMHRRLLEMWWREYIARIKALSQEDEYPLIVENYLAPTLARRLDLPLPHLFFIERPGQVKESLQLLAGTEALEAKLSRQTLLKLPGDQQPADLPLPAPLEPAPAAETIPATEIAVEPIALRVPAESLYVRFGNFSNYLWLSDFMRAWGGDLQNMIQVRSLDYGLLERRETQLALRQSALAQVLGPAVVADVAFVGYDTFMREGPAFGILFQARNNDLLANDIVGQRDAALKANPAITQETIQIAGKDVSFLHTPDNTVRSFYAVHGSYHLVCTSRELTRRFLEICAARGDGSLGRLAEFRAARERMPLDRNDTVFAYLSEPFQRQLISPHARVEMTRRTQARIDIQLWRLARLAAEAEGIPARSIDELVDAGLLPRGFAQRPDGSKPVEVEGVMLDSLRGNPRAFLPVADVEIRGVTANEVEAYQQFSDFYRAEWQRMDPVALAIRRNNLNDKGLQRLSIEMVAAPYVRDHFGPLGKWLGAPSNKAVPPVPGNLATFSVVLGRALGGAADAPDYFLFGGLREFQLPLARVGDKIRLMFVPRPLEYVQGYLGAWPIPGVLSLLTGLPGSPAGPDAEGYTPILQGIAWQRQWGDFTLISMKQEVLAQVAPQLQVVELPDPAQLRMEIVDPTATGSVETLNGLAFMRAREATVSNSRLMNRLSDQLRVPRAESQKVAEDLLGARLASALGGEYQLMQFPSGLRVWKSTALDPINQFALTEVPRQYEFPALKWFRGVDARVLITDDALNGFINIDMQGEPAARPTFQIPQLPKLPSIPGLGGK